MIDFLLSICVSFFAVRVGRMPRTPPFLGKDIPMLSFLFCLRGGGGVEEELVATDRFLGSLESRLFWAHH